MSEPKSNRFFAPRFVLPALLLLIVALSLFSPTTNPFDTSARLSTKSSGPKGARGLYESARRLGWNVEQRVTRFHGQLDAGVTYAVLSTPIEHDARERAALLDAVRRGASLLYVTSRQTPLLDSLGAGTAGGLHSVVMPGAGIIPRITPAGDECRGGVLAQPTGLDMLGATFELGESRRFDTTTFVQAATLRDVEVVAVGFPFGAGKVVIVSAPGLFRNDAIRPCERVEGVLAMRMLEWLSPERGSTIQFDEYHHGHGEQDKGMLATVRDAVAANPAGRMLIQWIAASLVLLLAVAPRPIPPRPRQIIERRSPFEHVGALARAYEKVGGTRRGTRLLVRGLRRRRDAAAVGRGTDEEFLARVAERHRILASDVAKVKSALNVRTTPAEFLEVGERIANIERVLTSEYS